MQAITKIFKKASALAMLFVAGAAIAQAQFTFTNPLTNAPGTSGDKGLSEIIDGIMGFLLGVALLVCPILIIWGAFLIATSGGDQEKTKTGRKIITYAVVGLVIIALSAVIKAIIFDIVNP